MTGRVDADSEGGVGVGAVGATSRGIGACAALDLGGSDLLGPPAGCPAVPGSGCGWGTEATVTRGDDVGAEDPAGSGGTASGEGASSPTRCYAGADPGEDGTEVGEICAGASIS